MTRRHWGVSAIVLCLALTLFAPTGIAKEGLRFALPSGWEAIGAGKISNEVMGDPFGAVDFRPVVTAYRPKGQNDSNWREMLTVFLLRRNTLVPPAALFREFLAGFDSACLEGQATAPEIESTKFFSMTGIYACRQVKAKQWSVFSIFKVIEGRESFHVIVYSKKNKPVSSQDLAGFMPTAKDKYRKSLEWFAKLEVTSDVAEQRLARIGSGSGFFVNRRGHIVTNNHVIDNCSELRVEGHGTVAVVARDADADLAVLRSKTPSKGFAALADRRQLNPGEEIVVVGYPLGKELSKNSSVSVGIVNSVDLEIGKKNLIQVSAPIQSGNSGGPVLDAHGKVVAVMQGSIVSADPNQAITQNLNLAVDAKTLAKFLSMNAVEFRSGAADGPGSDLDVVKVGNVGRSFTVPIECWR